MALSCFLHFYEELFFTAKNTLKKKSDIGSCRPFSNDTTVFIGSVILLHRQLSSFKKIKATLA